MAVTDTDIELDFPRWTCDIQRDRIIVHIDRGNIDALQGFLMALQYDLVHIDDLQPAGQG
jgi:hypothetical protein